MAVFLMENGVLSMGNKTPVTILQEALQKRGLIPHYELIYNGVGTLDPVFKYQVSAAGYTAIGDGKSKKEAKHDAAAALLKRMQQGNSRAVTEHNGVQASQPVAEDIASPYTGALKQNFVGMLDETCVNNKIPLPVFVPISEDGPPHARIFTMQCRVSSCTETAIARTKKQAKHMAAQQMISRVTDILGDQFIPLSEKLMDLEEELTKAPNLKAIESGSFRHDFSIPFVDLCNVFYLKQEEFLVPQEFLDLPLKSEEFYEQIEEPKHFLDNLLKGLEGTCKTITISKKEIEKTIQEIEKDCENTFYLDDNSSESDHCRESNYLEDGENNLTGFSNCVLEEFNLGDENDNNSLIKDNHVKSEEKLTRKSVSENTASKLIPNLIFLRVECPQGLWVFNGNGSSLKEIVDDAAVNAIKFLRVMSIPSSPNKLQVETTSNSY